MGRWHSLYGEIVAWVRAGVVGRPGAYEGEVCRGGRRGAGWCAGVQGWGS